MILHKRTRLFSESKDDPTINCPYCNEINEIDWPKTTHTGFVCWNCKANIYLEVFRYAKFSVYKAIPFEKQAKEAESGKEG